MEHLQPRSITHAAIGRYQSIELDRELTARSAVRYLRFGGQVRVNRLELPLSTQVGRWVPKVPSHPAHVVVSVLDADTRRWRVIRDVDLPADPRIAGEGLTQDTPIAEMEEHFAAVVRDTCHVIELGGVETDLLRVECDREHPVWENHGECNGGTHNVPWAILEPLRAVGAAAESGPGAVPPSGDAPVAAGRAERMPLLHIDRCTPLPPDGMRLHDLPTMLLYESSTLAVGFSLRRPLLMHLGWDAWADAGTPRNRLCLRRKDAPAIGGVSGPVLRTLQLDEAAHLWGGTVDVDGNRVTYRVSPGSSRVRITAAFTVHRDRLELELEQECDGDLAVLEAEAWRFAWDLRAGMTSTAGLPSLEPGRNGHVLPPYWFVGDGAGCLSCTVVGSAPYPDPAGHEGATAFLQTESHHRAQARTDGIVLAERPDPDGCLTLPGGRRTARLVFTVAGFEPAAHLPAAHESAAPGSDLPGVRRYWGTVFSCFRPELAGFSNHSASTNCHVNQWAPVEICAYSRRPVDGPDPIALARFTVEAALMGGGGYGYHRRLYLDSDPVLVSMAGRIYQADPDRSWVSRIGPGFRAAYDRIIATIGDEGLALCRTLTGNTGSHRWGSNAMDVVGFGHMDAYVNAWSYRALRTSAAIFRETGDRQRAAEAADRADRLRAAFAMHLCNPRTGWIAGWRSRDGQLHDYAFLWANGPALCFGLLDGANARTALEGLERLRREVGLESGRTGLPANLLPIDPGDQMAGIFTPPGQPSFELYTDGGMSGSAGYYLRALSIHGLDEAARRLAAELDDGYARGVFCGAMGEGQEFLTWEGLPTGYEGTLIVRLDSLYAIAIQAGLVQPYEPEWWPA